MDHGKMFDTLYPAFFTDPGIRALGADQVFTELALDLKTYAPRPPVPCAEGAVFGVYKGGMEDLRAAVRLVDGDWARYFDGNGRYFTALEEGRITSFCILDDMGRHGYRRVGGPGCVGTLPDCRGRGTGLRLVQLATELFRDEGFDLSWIHYTHLENWYARLGYVPVLRWNGDGILWTADQ